jgi:chorismate mutase/prephenate dehydrogenase
VIIFIQDLDNLRERIKGIDYSIMALISQRVNLALKIGKLKTEKNLPVRNFQVEKQVFERIKGYSEEFDLNYAFSKELYKQIISQSVDAQMVDKLKLIKPTLNQKVLIIGGAGKMGSWFTKFLSSSGYDVEIVDPRSQNVEAGPREIPDDLEGFEYIVVCVPLDKMHEVLEEVVKRKPSGTVFEIASLKSSIIDLVEVANSQGVNLISLHPMFGPDVTDLSDRNLILCTGYQDKDWGLSQVKQVFKDTMVNIQQLELKDHDRKMLYSLGLSHFVNILNGFILSKSDIRFSDMRKFAGTTFNNQIKTTSEVYGENPELYFSIQQINAYQDQLYSEIQQSTHELIEIIKDNDNTKFLNIMRDGHNYLTEVDLY